MHFKNDHSRLNLKVVFAMLAVALWSAPVFAQLRVGLDFSSVQEKRSATQISSAGRTLMDAYFNLAFKKELPLYLTLGYLNITSIENYDDSSFTKLISTNPYVGLTYHFWSKNAVGLMVGGFYSPYAKLGVSEETGTETWNGKTMVGKMAGTFSISAKFKINAGLYYISESFGSRASGNVTSESSFSQSYLAPSIGVAVAF